MSRMAYLDFEPA